MASFSELGCLQKSMNPLEIDFTTVDIDFTTMEVDSYNLGKLFFFLMEMNPSLKHSTGK